VLEAAARETCTGYRRFECATLLARWLSDDPESERLEILREELRNEVLNSPLPDTMELKNVAVLFGQSPFRTLDGPESLARANRISTMFLLYYHHAVPFERRRLRAIWNQCVDRNCNEARRRLERQVGSLER
jgi:hypothetical protein